MKVGSVLLVAMALQLAQAWIPITYYITPTPDQPCRHGDCYTLSEVMRNTDRFFIIGTTLEFLPGEHILDTGTVLLERLTEVYFVGDISLSPNVTTVITCSASSAIMFVNVHIVEITRIAFRSCGSSVNHGKGRYNTLVNEKARHTLPAITVISVHLSMIACTMTEGHLPLFIYDSWVILKNCTFEKNQGDYGGALLVYNSTTVFQEHSAFYSNTALINGGAIFAEESFLKFQGLTYFINNLGGTHTYASAGAGGAMYLSYCTATFYNSVTFLNNSAGGSGGAIHSHETNCTFLGYKNHYTFISNSAPVLKGGGIALQDSHMTFIGTTTFDGNSALFGGGIEASHAKLRFIGQTTFTRNSAEFGGGISTSILTIVKFTATKKNIFSNNTALFGGWMNSEEDTVLEFVGKGYFSNNSAQVLGGVLVGWESRLNFSGNLQFIGNSAFHGGAFFLDDSTISISGVHNYTNNAAIYEGIRGYGGGLLARMTLMVFWGNQSFVNNSASYGGALAIIQYEARKLLVFAANSYTFFRYNYAVNKGGALSVVEDTSVTHCPLRTHPVLRLQVIPCFFLLQDKTAVKHLGSVIFEGNTAEEGGSILYGGNLQQCRVGLDRSDPLGKNTFEKISGISLEECSTTPLISSYPFRVCACEDTEPNCTRASMRYRVYPGKSISIDVVAVGQLNGTVAAVIRAQLEEPEEAQISHLQLTQTISKTCSSLQYALSKGNGATGNKAKLSLFAEGPCGALGKSLTLQVEFLLCPPGFALSQSGVCDCEKRLQRYTTDCNINNETFTRNGNFWMGYDRSKGLLLHPHCPFDYCTLETHSMTMNSTDLQCVYGRSRVLCGACKSGLSLKFGSSRCSKCSSVFTLITLPLALAGVLLVLSLFCCKLTVADGTFSGLIFYSNIVSVNQALLFPTNERSFLTVFIAWLNLDLGIETCFFDGMDMYIRTWLQFVFPVYIWLLVGLVTLLSRYSIRFARIIGPTNPVAVLATLFLLSYTKFLRTIIATFAFTTLDYPNGKSAVVWVHDGNIGYLEGRHIPLFMAGLLASLFIFLPYTLFLVFGQCIVAGSNSKFLFWANSAKLKFFLDSYHAPYKHRHQYWVGLLLVVRFVLFTISAVIDINSPRDPSVNLLLLIITCGMLLIWMVNLGSVYKKWYNNVLESSFILNLIILAGASYHVKVDGGSRNAVFYSSVSAAFVTFLGIIAHHIIQCFRDTRVWRLSIKPFLLRLRFRQDTHEEPPVELTTPQATPQPVATTFVELREPLLESNT